MKRTIDINGGSKDDTLLHADGDRASAIAKEVFDYIEERFRAHNPDMPPDSLICGGCFNTLMINMHKMTARRSGATGRDLAKHYRMMGDEMAEFEFGASRLGDKMLKEDGND